MKPNTLIFTNPAIRDYLAIKLQVVYGYDETKICYLTGPGTFSIYDLKDTDKYLLLFRENEAEEIAKILKDMQDESGLITWYNELNNRLEYLTNTN